MSDWPPNPQQTQHSSNAPQSSATTHSTGREWDILEKALLASTKEQTRARRWGIFFKCLTFVYLFVVILVMGKGCATSSAMSDEDPSQAHLAVVDIIGTIDATNPQGVNSETTARALKEAFEASNSQAIALNINSPGGSPVQSDEIWQEIRALKAQYPSKKVYAVIGDTGASGAYYIASAADEIWVNPSSLVGSIGVIMPNYGLNGLLQKWGVEDRTMIAGENKNLLSMTQPINPAQRQHVQGVLNNVHQHFIQAVKEGRGKRLKDDPAIFSGLFWTGEQAVALGVADKMGGLASLKKTLKLESQVNYTVPSSPLNELFGQLGVALGQGIGLSLSQSTLPVEQKANLQ